MNVRDVLLIAILLQFQETLQQALIEYPQCVKQQQQPFHDCYADATTKDCNSCTTDDYGHMTCTAMWCGPVRPHEEKMRICSEKHKKLLRAEQDCLDRVDNAVWLALWWKLALVGAAAGVVRLASTCLTIVIE
jgi:hypothetical protein